MSREIAQEPYFNLPDHDRLRFLAEIYAPFVDSQIAEDLNQRVNELGLEFNNDELIIISALDHPDKVQQFLNTFIYYNYDHPVIGHISGDRETAFSPKQVLAMGKAHCFEGAMLAYMIDYLHGFSPKLVFLQAIVDYPHNLIVWQDKITGLWGANAQSGYSAILGRRAQFKTIADLARSYYPHYWSGRSEDPQDFSLVGYSHPVDLVEKFGTSWMDAGSEIWHIYETYIDESTPFVYLDGDPTKTHMLPEFYAKKMNWVRTDIDGKSRVSVTDLPPVAQMLWTIFWNIYDPEKEPFPKGRALELQRSFFNITGTTQIDLRDLAAGSEVV